MTDLNPNFGNLFNIIELFILSKAFEKSVRSRLLDLVYVQPLINTV